MGFCFFWTDVLNIIEQGGGLKKKHEVLVLVNSGTLSIPMYRIFDTIGLRRCTRTLTSSTNSSLGKKQTQLNRGKREGDKVTQTDNVRNISNTFFLHSYLECYITIFYFEST